MLLLYFHFFALLVASLGLGAAVAVGDFTAETLEKEKIKKFLLQKKVSQATRDYIEKLKKQAKIKTYF